MKQQQHNKPITINDSLIELLIDENKEGSEYAKEVLVFICSVLTPIQRKQVLKKVRICKFYVKSMNNSLDKKRIKSIITNKEKIKRQNINSVCQPCSIYYISEVKNKNNVMW